MACTTAEHGKSWLGAVYILLICYYIYLSVHIMIQNSPLTCIIFCIIFGMCSLIIFFNKIFSYNLEPYL